MRSIILSAVLAATTALPVAADTIRVGMSGGYFPFTFTRADELQGFEVDLMNAVGENTAIVVMSDHGFSSFRRQVHLNRWLEQHGVGLAGVNSINWARLMAQVVYFFYAAVRLGAPVRYGPGRRPGSPAPRQRDGRRPR